MIFHNTLSQQELFRLIRSGVVHFAGNKKLRIYGTFHCHSGKRMKRENRVLFASKDEAEASGFRACKNCKP